MNLKKIYTLLILDNNNNNKILSSNNNKKKFNHNKEYLVRLRTKLINL